MSLAPDLDVPLDMLWHPGLAQLPPDLALSLVALPEAILAKPSFFNHGLLHDTDWCAEVRPPAAEA